MRSSVNFGQVESEPLRPDEEVRDAPATDQHARRDQAAVRQAKLALLHLARPIQRAEQQHAPIVVVADQADAAVGDDYASRPLHSLDRADLDSVAGELEEREVGVRARPRAPMSDVQCVAVVDPASPTLVVLPNLLEGGIPPDDSGRPERLRCANVPPAQIAVHALIEVPRPNCPLSVGKKMLNPVPERAPGHLLAPFVEDQGVPLWTVRVPFTPRSGDEEAPTGQRLHQRMGDRQRRDFDDLIRSGRRPRVSRQRNWRRRSRRGLWEPGLRRSLGSGNKALATFETGPDSNGTIGPDAHGLQTIGLPNAQSCRTRTTRSSGVGFEISLTQLRAHKVRSAASRSYTPTMERSCVTLFGLFLVGFLAVATASIYVAFVTENGTDIGHWRYLAMAVFDLVLVGTPIVLITAAGYVWVQAWRGAHGLPITRRTYALAAVAAVFAVTMAIGRPKSDAVALFAEHAAQLAS